MCRQSKAEIRICTVWLAMVEKSIVMLCDGIVSFSLAMALYSPVVSSNGKAM